jgi:hypothetical protein
MAQKPLEYVTFSGIVATMASSRSFFMPASKRAEFISIARTSFTAEKLRSVYRYSVLIM